MQKNLLTLLSTLIFTLSMTTSFAQGTFDVRFLIDSVDCTNSKLFIDLQVRADNPGQEYFLGDQNYRFSFNRNVLDNPQLVQELDVAGFINGGPGAIGFSFYSPHTLTGSLDTIVSYNLELQGGDGIFTTDTDYISVGRMSLDILDFNTPVFLRWHRDIPVDFPNTFVGQSLNGSLIPTAEGSYLDYRQDLSTACSNSAPTATDDTGTTPEEQPIMLCLPTNDTDPENALNNMSVTLLSMPPASEGTVALDATTGCITFTPAADFFGTVTAFDYEICDLGVQIPSYQGDNNPLPIPQPDPGNPPIDAQPPACTTATINLTVTNVNDIPLAVDDSETTPEDTPLNSDVTPNDSDVDGDNLTVNTTPLVAPANGMLVLNANGTYTYTPNPNFSGTDTFEYEICDDGMPSLCASAVVTITITPVNDAPIAVDDSETTPEDTPLSADVSPNDSDADADPLTVTTTPTVAPANGMLVLNADGTYTYTPNADFNGTDSFEYEICDNGNPALCDNAVVTITVTPVNDAPIAADDSETTPEDTPLSADVSPNDSDVDADPLTVTTTPTVAPANGMLVLNADGTYTYTPNADFNGTDSFEYEICDNGNPALCDNAVVTITVTSVNDAPIAADDTETTQEEVTINSDVTPNDIEPDGDNFVVNTTPIVAPTNGTLTLNNDGTYTYIPAINFNGTDSFTYEVCDDQVPALCDMATVTITVDPVNDIPVAIDDSETTPEDTPLSADVSPNDSDVDADPLTVTTTPTVAPANGMLVLNADGTYTYTPNADFNGTDSFEYEICDNGNPALCDNAVVTITVTPVNDAPIAIDDSETTSEDAPLSADVSPNDSDVDADPLTVTTTPTVAPANGMLVLNADGTYTYTPNADFNGTDSFEYEICDNGNPALCDNAVVTITVTPVNDAPIAVDDSETTPEDTPLSADVSPNDSDADADPLTVTTTPIVAPANGMLVLNADGTYTYTPNANFNGTDSFEYEICDNGNPALCDNAVVTITIDSVNDAPIAVDDSETTSEDTPLSADVSPNDSDIDMDNLTVTTTPVTPPSNGMLVLNADGTYTYTPNADFNGTDSFVYEICDDGSPVLCDQATVTITIDPVNDMPVAVDDAETTAEDTPVSGDVSPNDSDIDGDNLTVTTTPTAVPTNGTVVLNADGTYTYTPNPDFNGTDSFRYEICDDGTPQLCAEAVVTITLTPVNDMPVAVDDFGTTPEDVAFNGSTLLSNDTDVDGDNLTINTTPISAPANGMVVINPDGTYTYTPNSGFNGSDTFEYEVCDDGTPQLCDIALVTITIDNVNDAPTILDDTDTTPEDTPLSAVSVLLNDTDIDGNNLTINTTPITNVTNGTLVINPDGTYLYTPNPNFNGTDSFVYEVCDDGVNPANLCGTATVTITVTPVNDTPIAVDDSGTTMEDVPLTGTTILANDSDVDTGDILTATVTPVTPPTNGAVVINSDGTYTYTPNADFNGTDSFVYEVCDNGTPIECTTATVNITVTSLNDAPVAVDDAETTPEDTAINSDVTPNDSDVDGDNLTVTTTPVLAPANGMLVLNASGTYTYTPNPNYFGTDSFEYEICDDGTPIECTTAAVNITITSVNDAPIAVDDMETTPEDTAISSDVTPNDSDVDVADNLTVNTTPLVAPANGILVLNANGTYTYTPNPQFFGTDSFTYEICDDGTPLECATAVVTIDVSSVNDQPIAIDDADTTPEDTPVTLDIIVNDSDTDTADNLTVTTMPTTPPANGTVALTPGGPATYTPNPDFFGTDTFEYEVCDNGSPILCDVATVTITVTPVNDAPVAVDDSETTSENMPLSSDVTPNDNDVDGDPLTVNTTPITPPANGTLVLNANGTYTYSPNAGYSGLDMFEYEICDNGSPALCDMATVTISIGAVNDPPIAVDDTATTPEDTPLNGASVLANDSDIDTGDILTVSTTPLTNVTNGTLVLNADGTYLYTPNPNFFGTDTFEYEICDNGTPVLCSSATVTITVDSVNDAPVAIDDAEATQEDTPVTADVLPNDSDDDTADILAATTTPITPPANGSVVLAANGTYTYTPNPNFFGTDTFEYEVCDNGTPVLCDMATVTITVSSVNDQPIALDDAETTQEDTAISSDVTPNDSDADVADMLTVNTTPLTNVTNGTLVLNADGTYTYTPNPNFFGTDSFEYEICDNANPALCDVAVVTITVDSVNDAPVALDDSETTTENTPVSSDVTPNDTDVDIADVLTVNTTPITPPANGTLVLNADGTYTYTPNPNYSGIDVFEYQICDDGNPVLCDIATVSIGVGAVNDPPTAINDSETTPEDTAISSDVTLNDNDIDGDNLTVTTTPVIAPLNGTLTLNADGTYTYTPNADFFGTDSFVYEICDDGTPSLCATATVMIDITPVNDAPIAVDDSETTLEDTAISSDVSPNDSDTETGPLTYMTVTGPSNGNLVLNSDGTYTYMPLPGFFGSDMFTYEVCDAGMPVLCTTATVFITITSDNDAPIAQNDIGITSEDTPLNSTLAANDEEPDDDNLVYTSTPVTGPSNGTVVINPDGTYTYTPNPNFNGIDNFTYEVCDDAVPQLCSEAVATITVNAVNDDPELLDDAAVTDESVPVDIDVVANDSDVEDGAIDPCSVTIMTPPLGGTISFGPAPACVLTYTPNSGFSGVDAFEYEVCDTDGSCSTAIVDVTVNALCLDVQLGVWLEGALSDLSNGFLPTMRTDLSDVRLLLPGQSNSVLPGGQPYNVAPWNYLGTEGAGWTDADYAAAAAAQGGSIVDWILVSFRTDIASNTTFLRAAALLFEDGSVVFPESCVLTASAPSAFYVVIEHRNHMGVMSHAPVSVTGGQFNYDFRIQDSWTSSTSFGQVQTDPGRYAMYGSDGDQIPDIFSYDINAVDKTTWLAENGIFGQYLFTDFNLDGDTNGGDKIIWSRNNGIASGVPK